MKACLKKHNVDWPVPQTPSKLLDKLCGHFVEDQIVSPTFISDHPEIMSPLAKWWVTESGDSVMVSVLQLWHHLVTMIHHDQNGESVTMQLYPSFDVWMNILEVVISVTVWCMIYYVYWFLLSESSSSYEFYDVSVLSQWWWLLPCYSQAQKVARIDRAMRIVYSWEGNREFLHRIEWPSTPTKMFHRSGQSESPGWRWSVYHRWGFLHITGVWLTPNRWMGTWHWQTGHVYVQ